MKKKMVMLMLLAVMLMTVGCTSKTGQETAPEPEIEAEPEAVPEEPVQETQAVEAVIYYGNEQADGLLQKTVQLDSVTPEHLISELAKLNVVSIDTKVNSFEQDGKSLKLDLSKGFSEYVNMMGTSGEYIVMGGLVDTFLTAFEAEEILITVDGKPLETGHAIYEEPLRFYELSTAQDGQETETDNKEPMKYRLGDASYTGDGKRVYYPQFADMPDSELEEKWNTVLKEIAVDENAQDEKIQYDSYKVDYEIASCDTEFVSFVFRRESEEGGRIGTDVFAISFDLVEGKNVRLSDWDEASAEAAENLATGGYYKILNKDIDREAFDEYMKSAAPDADEYKKEFALYDFDLENLTEEPLGTSYVKDGKLVLIMDVPAALGSTVEIDTGIEVR